MKLSKFQFKQKIHFIGSKIGLISLIQILVYLRQQILQSLMKNQNYKLQLNFINMEKYKIQLEQAINLIGQNIINYTDKLQKCTLNQSDNSLNKKILEFKNDQKNFILDLLAYLQNRDKQSLKRLILSKLNQQNPNHSQIELIIQKVFHVESTIIKTNTNKKQQQLNKLDTSKEKNVNKQPKIPTAINPQKNSGIIKNVFSYFKKDKQGESKPTEMIFPQKQTKHYFDKQKGRYVFEGEQQEQDKPPPPPPKKDEIIKKTIQVVPKEKNELQSMTAPPAFNRGGKKKAGKKQNKEVISNLIMIPSNLQSNTNEEDLTFVQFKNKVKQELKSILQIRFQENTQKMIRNNQQQTLKIKQILTRFEEQEKLANQINQLFKNSYQILLETAKVPNLHEINIINQNFNNIHDTSRQTLVKQLNRLQEERQNETNILKQKIKNLNTNIQTLQQILRQKQNKIIQQQQNLETKQYIKQLQQKIINKDNIIEQLESEISIKINTINNLEEQIEEKKNMILNTSIHQVQKQALTHLEKVIKEKQMVITNLQNNEQSLKRYCNTLLNSKNNVSLVNECINNQNILLQKIKKKRCNLHEEPKYQKETEYEIGNDDQRTSKNFIEMSNLINEIILKANHKIKVYEQKNINLFEIINTQKQKYLQQKNIYQTKIMNLNNQLIKLKSILENFKSDNNQSQSKIEQLKNLKLKSDKEIETLKRDHIFSKNLLEQATKNNNILTKKLEDQIQISEKNKNEKLFLENTYKLLVQEKNELEELSMTLNNQKQEAEEQIKKYAKNIQDLKTEIEALKRDQLQKISELEHMKDEYTNKILELQQNSNKKIIQYESELNKKSQEINKLQNDIQSNFIKSNAQIQNMKSNIETLIQQNNQKQSSMETIKNTHQIQLQQKNRYIEQLLFQKNKDLEDYNQLYDSYNYVQQNNKRLQQQAIQINKLIEQAKLDASKFAEQNNILSAEKDKLIEQKGKVTQQLNQTNQQINNLGEQIIKVLEQNKKLQQKILQLQQRILQQKKKFQQQNHRIVQQNKRILQQNQRILQQELAILTKTNNQLIQELKETNIKIDNYIQQQELYKKLQKQCQTKQRQIFILTQRLEETKVQNLDIKKNIKQKQILIEQLNQKVAQNDQVIPIMEQQILKNTENIQNLNTQIYELNNRIGIKQTQVNNLSNKINQLKHLLQQKQTQSNLLKNEYEYEKLQLVNQLRQFQSIDQDYQKQIHQKNDQIVVYQKKQQEQSFMIVNLNKKILQLGEQITQFESREQQYQKYIEFQNQKITQLQISLREYQENKSEFQKLKFEYKKLLELHTNQQDEIISMQNTLKSKLLIIQNQTSQIQSNQKSIEQLNQIIRIMEENSNTRIQILKKVENQYNLQKQQLVGLKEIITTLAKQKKELTEQIETNKQMTVTDIQNIKFQFRDKLSELELNLIKLRNQKQNIEKEKMEAEQLVETLNQALEKYQQKNDDESQIQKLKEQNNIQNQLLIESNLKYKNILKEFQEMNLKSQLLQKNLQQQQRTIQSLIQQKHNLNQNIKKLETQLSIQSKKVKDTQQIINHDYKNLSEENTVLKQLNIQLHSKIKNYEYQIIQLKNINETLQLNVKKEDSSDLEAIIQQQQSQIYVLNNQKEKLVIEIDKYENQIKNLERISEQLSKSGKQMQIQLKKMIEIKNLDQIKINKLNELIQDKQKRQVLLEQKIKKLQIEVQSGKVSQLKKIQQKLKNSQNQYQQILKDKVELLKLKEIQEARISQLQKQLIQKSNVSKINQKVQIQKIQTPNAGKVQKTLEKQIKPQQKLVKSQGAKNSSGLMSSISRFFLTTQEQNSLN